MVLLLMSVYREVTAVECLGRQSVDDWLGKRTSRENSLYMNIKKYNFLTKVKTGQRHTLNKVSYSYGFILSAHLLSTVTLIYVATRHLTVAAVQQNINAIISIFIL